MSNTQSAKPWSRGSVVGLSLGKFTWVGAGVAMLITGVALGAPQGATVVAGSAQIKQQGNLTKIIAADKTIINYSSFDIGRNETVRFIQPSATSKVLNRITSSDPTKIAGTIQANGIVYIVNPAGVFFANGSLVNVGGIYAAAGNISNNDFVRGVNNFTNVTGNVTNQGRMTIADGGVAALVGDKVTNSGVISADRGVIAMVSGNDVVLGERGGVMTVRVNRDADTAPKTGESGITNTGTVKAERGSVRMVAGDMYALAIKNTGTVKATDIKVEAQGKGNVSVSGKLDARNGVQGGYGGVIQVTGNKVAIVDANIDASGRNGGGKVNIGGEFQGKGDMKRSEVTIVDNSSIRADAIKRGNGGEVVVWSDQHTSFNGYASAKGGELSGNGGTIETSGKQTLDIRGGRVNASAENGKAGTWMMDPFDVTIDQVGSTTGGTFDGSDPDTFTPSATAVVDVDDVNLALNNGTNVEIITGGAGADAGNITLVGGAVIDKTSGAATSLTLRAANDINIDGTIQSSSGALDVNLLADNGAGSNVDPNPNVGVVNMGASGVINTAGGNLVIEGVDVVFAGGAAITTGAGNVTLRSTNSASTIGVGAGATGDFNVSDTELAAIDSTGTVKIGSVNGTGAVDVNALALGTETYSLDVEGGSINTESIALGNGTDLTLSANTGNIDESGTPTLTADGGTITLRANDITFDGNVTINAGAAGTVVFAPNAGRTVGVNPFSAFDFTIGQDEINNITADTLVIGSSNSGNMGVVSINAPGTVNNLTLLSGANIFGDIGLPTAIFASNTVTLDAVGQIGSTTDALVIGSTPNVVLNSGGDTFVGISSVVGTAITTAIDGNAEIFGTNSIDLTGTVGGNLEVTSLAGSIAATTFDVQGNAEFETSTANESISLLSTEIGGTVAFTTSGASGSVTMTSSGAIDVEASSIGGDLSLTSDTSITDSGAMVVGGNADFETRAASGGDIILDENHSFAGTVMARSRDAADSATGNGEIDIRDTDAAMNFAGGETTGDVTLRANNLDISGTLTGGDINLLPLSNGATIAINSAAGSFSLSSADLANIDSAGVVTVGNVNSGAIAIGSSGAIDLSAETYSLSLRGGSVSFSNGITLGNDTTLDIRSSGSITGSGTGNDVTIGGSDGSLVTVADGNIDLETSVARFAAEAGGTLTIDEASNLIVDSLNGITGASSVGNLAITTQGQLSVANAIATTGAGTISLNAEDGDNGNLVVNDTITSQGGNITLNAENDVTLNGDAVITVATGVGNVQITADSDTMNSGGDGTGGKITLADGAAITTAGNVAMTADGDIDDLGDSISSTAVIAGAEVSLISANGAIGATTSINTATTELIASGETGLAVTNTGNVDANLKSTTGAVVFRNTGTLDTSGTWQGDSIDIVSSGAIIVDEDITANAGDVSITSSTGSITVQTGDEIAASGGDITLAATDLILNGILDAGTDEIFIDRSVAGTIGVGDAAGDMTISGAELARMTAAELTIGGTNTTGITVDNVSATNVANLPIVNLDATRDDASITFNGGASTFRGLNAQADDGLSVNVNLAATDGDLILNGDADNAADTDDSLALASGITLSTEPMGGDVFLAATTGGIEAAGSLVVNANQDIILGSSISSPSSLALNANGEIILQTAQSGQTLTINADDGLTLNANVNNTASAAILNADADADGNGTLVLASGQTINTGNNDLTITAADLTLDGSITSGTGVVSIRRATNGTIGLGSATGDLQISGDELQRITAATLRLGNSMTTAVNVADVSATNTANISSLIELFTDNINITGAFNTADADLSITRGNTGTIGVGSSAGDLYIDGTELAFITTNELLLGGGQTTSINVGSVSAAQSMGIELLRLDSGDRIVFGGTDSTFRALSALARNGIAVNTNLTTTESNLILDANTDNDADSTDNLAIAADRTLTSGGLLTLDATSGGIDAAGGVTLNAKGDININDALTANGQITINADSDATGQGIINIPTGVNVISSGNPITLVGSNLTLNGNILAGAGSVAIRRSNVGTITLGTGTRGMSISGAELARITSTGLSIGGATTRTLEVNGITAANSNNIVGITRLEAGADNGSVVFNGSASVFNALEVFADNSINVNAAVSTDTGGITMDADLDNAADGVDAVRLGANVTAPTTQDVVFNSAVQLRKDVTVTGNDITFNGTIDSETGRRGLSVNSNNTGITSFNGAVGGNKALLGIVTNADGTTRLGANIDTDGGSSLFNDIIRLTNDVRIRAKSGGGIFFNNVVDSQGATNRNLTVLVDTDTAANANSVPVISFAQNVGSTFALGNLFLNYDPSSNVDGHTNVPRVATIVARPRNSSGAIVNNPASSITFNTSGTFRMGKNEKLTAGGILNINAGTAVLGDLTSLGNMNVTASNIQLIRRNASQIIGTTNTSIAFDQGTDYVSGGNIAFSTVPTAIGTGAEPSFSTSSGTGDVNNMLGGFLFRAFGPINAADINNGTSSIVTLDLKADGPTNTNFADAIAGAIPRETRQNDVGQETSIGQAQMEDLKNLGIVPRNPTTQELLDFLIGRAVYNDMPRRTLPRADDYTTVVNRLPGERVAALLKSYDEVFNTDLTDEAGNKVLDEKTGVAKRVSRADEIKSTLLDSVRRFRSENETLTGEPDPVQFRTFVDNSAEDVKSAEFLDQLAGFLDQLESLGLTPRELQTSKNIMLKDVRPAGIGSVANFEAVIRSRPKVGADTLSMR